MCNFQAVTKSSKWRGGYPSNHAGACDTKSELEAVVVQIFGGTISIVRLRFETAVAITASVSADR